MSEAPTPLGPNERYPFTPYARGWFRVAYADELSSGELKKLHLFGREIVLYRTESGEPCLVDAYCPHLGAHLGVGGAVVGESIRCPFHHWEFGADGVCSHIPYAKKIPPKAKLVTWPLIEKNGLLLAYYDAAGGQPDFEIPEVPELAEEGWLPLDRNFWTVRANWIDMNENCVDQAHFKYIHGTLSIPPTTARIEGALHVATSLFRMRTPDGETDAELVTLDYGPGFQLVRMGGLIDSLLINTATPIDAERTDVSFAYTVKTDGDSRKEKLAEAIVRDLKHQFDSDLPIWENKAHWPRPNLCGGDGPIPTYRKWYAQFV